MLAGSGEEAGGTMLARGARCEISGLVAAAQHNGSRCTLSEFNAASGRWQVNPQPSNPQPSTLNPQPSALNPEPSTLNPNPQPQTFHQVPNWSAKGKGKFSTV